MPAILARAVLRRRPSRRERVAVRRDRRRLGRSILFSCGIFMARLEGLYPAVFTAYDETGRLDLKTQVELARRLAAAGVHGLFLCGTTGEFPLLSLAERKRLVECVASEVRGGLELIVHVGAPSTEAACELARHARDAGATAVASVPPYYYEHRPAGIVAYFEAVARASDLPFFAYHIPARTHVRLGEDVLDEAVRLPGFAGVKYSDSDLRALGRWLDRYGDGFCVFHGDDATLFPALALGARGAVGSSFNFLAEAFSALFTAFREGDWAKAGSLQLRINRVLDVTDAYPAPAAGKCVLERRGLRCGLPRPPLDTLSAGERARLEEELDAAGFETLITGG